MLKVFLDTNILVSATFWKGSSYKLFLKILHDEISGYTSNDILQEYRNVLKRDFQLDENEVDIRIEKFIKVLEIVSPSKTLDVIKEDPTDNRVLEGAIEAEADFIVSYDQHLLKLKKYNRISIAPPEQVIEYHGSNSISNISA